MSAIIIKTGREHMDVEMIHRFLSEDSYWAKGISYTFVAQSLAHSFCVGAFIGDQQVGFGRVITDYYTFGWFADIFVLPAYRGQGISKEIVGHIMDLPWSKRLRRKMLNTSDAHGLYRQFDFKELKSPANVLEVHQPDIHLQVRE
ncbi:GNAT family N-acetyltransferase [Chitinophaga pinensis]|uniref:GCN5-related N-acetyltransferase n=1 Tax=Chitinophaga pinensis (strain ATCC 43595 / DSM 2588 / LMG 13176 / NBRC 15968 / NCIMB 11800 / UQM 2034) TaxID=485918 RepID=A0A979G7U8_CHIPD|nr:GNAT family N-acetyltransferase [Chitinophaga pinensis]ACU62243.1 GCN5-related N-acetyltransferase [Chitinophaga pinensis DSM 2588]